MSNVIDLSERKKKNQEAQEAEGQDDHYYDALTVLDEILTLKDGEGMLVYYLDGELLIRRLTGGQRYQIDPEDLK